VEIGDTFFTLPQVQIWVGHFPHNRAGANQCNLCDQIIKACWFVAWRRRHLSASFNLEHTYCVCSPDRVVNIGAILGQMSQIYFLTIVIADQLDAVLENGHLSQTEQVNFDEAKISTVILVPLDDHSSRHRRWFERDDGIELSLANNHASRMLAQMTRQVLHSFAEIEINSDLRMTKVKTTVAELPFHRVIRVFPLPCAYDRRELGYRVLVKPEHLSHFLCC